MNDDSGSVIDRNVHGFRRWDGFDLLKGVSCLAVVLIHYNFKGVFGEEVKAACRFAVPAFLMISGYFLHSYDGGDVRTDVIMRKVLKLTRLLVVSTLSYGILMWLITPSSAFLGKYLSAAALAKFALTNDGLFNAGLWFIGALIYCYFLVAMLCRRETALRWMLLLAIPTLAMMSVTQEFARVIGFKWNFLTLIGAEPRAVVCLHALFLFRALPFLLIGSWLRWRAPEIRRMMLPSWMLWTVVVLGSAMSVAEYHFLGNRLAQFYVGSYITTLALMLLAVRTSVCTGRIGRCLVWVGSELSMLVYLTHVGVGKVLDMVAGSCHWWGNRIYDLSRWLIVMAGSIAVSLALRYVIMMVKRKFMVYPKCGASEGVFNA